VTDTDLTLRGVAFRGARITETPELANGVTLPTEPVTLRTLHDELLGEARLSWLDGDVFVEATLPTDRLIKLIGSPHFCVAIRVNEDEDDEPAVVAFIAVCASVTDPFQLPYRISGAPDHWQDWLRRYDYRLTRIVDEAHEVEVSLDPQTNEVATRFDEGKSHVEWRHESEDRQRALPNAVAQGFGYDTWEDLTGEETGNGLTVARNVLDQVTRLGRR
jgi:hypothetical protein